MRRCRLHIAGLLLLLALFVGGGSPLGAQSPRIILVEEISNASCGPCAVENPAFEKFVGASEQMAASATIVYHSNWPGRDIMNARSPLMNGARVAYYGINGVPRVMVNGAEPKGSGAWRNGAPGDIVAIDSAIDLVRGSISPITIRIDQSRRQDSVVATIDLQSVEAVAGRTLRIVVVEAEHYYPAAEAGTNGEEHFLYVARAMLPSSEGTTITIPAGGAQRVTASTAIDPEWNASDIYIVAFLQNDTTREVLQTATSRGMATLDGDDPIALRRLDTMPGRWSFDIFSADTNHYRIEIDADLPPLWDLSVAIGGTRLADGEIITLTSEELKSLDVQMTPSALNPGRGSFRVTLRGDRSATASREGRLYAGKLEVLALRRENADLPIADLYEPGLGLSPLSWAMVEPEDESLVDIDSVEILAFLVGSRALDSSDIALLKRHLDGGGRLLLAGSEIAWGLSDADHNEVKFPRDEQFLRDELHSRYISGDSRTTAINGIAADPVGAGISLQLREQWEMRTTPDLIRPLPPARTALSYGASRNDAAAVRYANDSTRILFFSFGFEGVADSAVRTRLVERGIRWLLGSDLTLSAPSIADAHFSVGLPSPNPASDRVAIPIELASGGMVRVGLTDIIGRTIIASREQHLAGGNHMVPLDIDRLPAGIYLVTVEIEGARTVRRIVVGG